MAVEAKRGCGFRKVGGLYLVGTGIGVVCDRLPLPIEPCPVCGAEPRFTRGIARIEPARLWGDHLLDATLSGHPCPEDTCAVCRPGAKGYLMWVGSEYTPEPFISEARRLGVSKRIPQIPADLQVGADWVYLAAVHAIPDKGRWVLLDDDPRRGWGPGVFYAFKPLRVEKIVTDQTPGEEIETLRNAGIEPVVVPHDDPDHCARRKRGSPQDEE